MRFLRVISQLLSVNLAGFRKLLLKRRQRLAQFGGLFARAGEIPSSRAIQGLRLLGLLHQNGFEIRLGLFDPSLGGFGFFP